MTCRICYTINPNFINILNFSSVVLPKLKLFLKTIYLLIFYVKVNQFILCLFIRFEIRSEHSGLETQLVNTKYVCTLALPNILKAYRLSTHFMSSAVRNMASPYFDEFVLLLIFLRDWLLAP